MALLKSNIPWAIKIDNFPEQENILTYDGGNLSPTWKFFDAEKMYISGGTTSEINAGTYFTEFLPFRKFVFPNGTKKIYRAPWTINKAENIITLSETSGEVKIKKTRQFTISRLGDGDISVSSSDPDIAAVSLSGNVVTITGKKVGDVTITVNVAEGTNYLASSKTYACQSRKTQIPIPTVSGTSKTFSGGYQSPTITNAPSSDLVNLTGTFSAYNYSDTPYSFTYSIRDTDACEWANGSISPRTYSWKINKAIFALPVQVGSLTYNGNYQYPTWNFGSTNLIAITNGSAVKAGTHTATFSLRDTFNCAWADGSTSDKSATFTIAKKEVAVPAQKGSLTFNGSQQSPTWNNFDSSLMTISGSTSGTGAGSYTTYFGLKDTVNYVWDDNTTSASHSAYWAIAKADFPELNPEIFVPKDIAYHGYGDWTSAIPITTAKYISSGRAFYVAVPAGWTIYFYCSVSASDYISFRSDHSVGDELATKSSIPFDLRSGYQVYEVGLWYPEENKGKFATVGIYFVDPDGNYKTSPKFPLFSGNRT